MNVTLKDEIDYERIFSKNKRKKVLNILIFYSQLHFSTITLSLYLHRSTSMKKLIRITTIPLSLDKLLGEQLRFMNQHYEVTAVSADKNELQRIAQKYAVKYHHVEMTRTISPLKDLTAVWKLYRYLKKEKPEIVHTHTPKAGIVGMMAAYMAGIPVRMHTVAGLPLLETQGIKRKILNSVEKITYYFANQVYPNSKGLYEIILQEKFCKPEKLSIIANGSSNGIDTDYFSASQISDVQQTILRDQLGLTKDDFVFIFVGRLVKDKGIQELVRAFKELKNKPATASKNIKLLLVGPFEPELDPLSHETTDDIKHHPDIIVTGFQDDVRTYFSISNTLVFPSYREGFPNVVMQAGAMDLPAIVSNINGCNEIIKNGKNGIIIPVKDWESLSSAMEEILNNDETFSILKSNARDAIVSQYQQKLVWNALLKEYNRLIL